MKPVLMKLYLFLLVTSFISCAQTENPPSMSVQELRNEMKENSNLIILDVRTPQELAGPLGHIDGVINIPVQELGRRINELEKFKDKDIAVICRTGNRSTYGTELLIKHGFKARNVLGGMTEYRSSEN
ncbi:MAG: rhodanese-like domain-containing protein [Ignavibacteriaceae bacterium]